MISPSLPASDSFSVIRSTLAFHECPSSDDDAVRLLTGVHLEEFEIEMLSLTYPLPTSIPQSLSIPYGVFSQLLLSENWVSFALATLP